MKQLLLHLLSHLFTSLQVFQIASSFHFQASLSLSQRQRSVAVAVSLSVSVQEVPTLMNNNLRSPLRKKIKPPFQRASMALSTSADLKEHGKESKPKGPIYITIGPQVCTDTSIYACMYVCMYACWQVEFQLSNTCTLLKFIWPVIDEYSLIHNPNIHVIYNTSIV